MTRAHAKPTDSAKAAGSLAAVYACLIREVDPEETSLFLRTTLGPGWSFVSAIQYLTGTEGQAAARSLPPAALPSGLGRADVDLLIAAAHHACANTSPAGPMSAGKLVGSFAGDDGAKLLAGLHALRRRLRRAT